MNDVLEDLVALTNRIDAERKAYGEEIRHLPGFWDNFYLGLAKYYSTASKDPSTRTGAVIVRSDNTFCSAGYNGFPRKMPDFKKWYDDRETKYSKIIHCEINAQLFAREPLDGYTLYTYPFLSCDRCFVQMAEAGIVRFVAPVCPEHLKARWEEGFQKVRESAKLMGIEICEVEFEHTA